MKKKLYGLFLCLPFMQFISVAEPLCASDTGTCYFFGFNKSRPSDAALMQQRGYDAVQSVSALMEQPGFEKHLLQTPVGNPDEPIKRSAFTVTYKSVQDRLTFWGNTLNSNDTILIYSHTHGLKSRPDRPGGLGLGPDPTDRTQPPILTWQEYAEKLLDLPAKTVVVLTMACHSGELTDYLNTNETTKQKLQDRKENDRDFLVITSQNADSLSNPRRIEGQVINPFTYAVMKAFEGDADGYQSGNPDGAITLGELSQFILDETRKHTRSRDEKNDPDPQMTGSFNPNTVIARRKKGTRACICAQSATRTLCHYGVRWAEGFE